MLTIEREDAPIAGGVVKRDFQLTHLAREWAGRLPLRNFVFPSKMILEILDRNHLIAPPA